MAKRAKLQRVQQERRALDCPTCGSSNRITPAVIDRGFTRCTHCGAAMPVVGAGSYAYRVPGGGFTRVISPGRNLLIFGPQEVVDLALFVFVFLVGDFVTTVVRLAAIHSLERPLIGVIVKIVYYVAVVMFFLAMFVEQRLLFHLNRCEASWTLFGRRIRGRRLATYGMTFEHRGGHYTALVLKPRSGRSWKVRTGSSTATNEALEREIREAIQESRTPVASERTSCPGCGGPVLTTLQLLQERGADCPHCGGGIMAVGGGVVLRECLVSHDVKYRQRPRTRRSTRDGLEWRLRPDILARPVVTAIGWLFLLGVGAGIIALAALIVHLSEQWRAFGLTFALILVPIAVGLIWIATQSAFGRRRLLLDDAVFESDLYLGPFRVQRTLVPLARLKSLRIHQGEPKLGSPTELRIETTSDEHELSLTHDGGEGPAVARDLHDEIVGRLRTMGRRVRSTESQREEASPDCSNEGGEIDE